MEDLSRFDVAEYGGIYMVVVESDLLPPDPSVVVIPLLQGYPAVRYLNPEIQHDGQGFVLATSHRNGCHCFHHARSGS